MKRPPGAEPELLMDACVLIDFLKANQRSALRRIARRLGPVHVLMAVVEEVRQIGHESELEQLGLRLVEEDIEDAFAAGSVAGPISFQDRLCLLTARRHGFRLVTNDARLRKACQHAGIALAWGLELLIWLHQRGEVSGAEAMAIARAIGAINRRHITGAVMERFRKAIDAQGQAF